MRAPTSRALIVVTSVVVALVCACATPVVNQQKAGIPATNVEELWQMPHDLAARDLFHGPGGALRAPAADAPFTWIATDSSGFSPGFDVRGPDGRQWSVKLGPEAQTEVVVSRILWALGYHQPPVYYVPSWELSGGPSGRQQGARFRVDPEDPKVVGDWAWTDNDFIGTQPFHGLIAANILLNSWDWKASNNKIYQHADGSRRYVVRDLGASLGKTSRSRFLGVLQIPIRGFGQGTRNDIAGFESQRFIKRADETDVEFDFHTIYPSVVDLVRASDVRWMAESFSRITDRQWEDAFRAGAFSPEVRARYIRKIKAKIAEGLAVS